MKKVTLLASLFLLGFIPGILAEKSIPMMDVLFSGGVAVPNPVLIDSVNVKNKSFEAAELMKNTFSPAAFTSLKAGADSVFRSTGKPTENELYVWKFFVTPKEYVPLKLDIRSASMFEIYVDGEKKDDKRSPDKSWNKSYPLTVRLDADPRQYLVTVKMLVRPADSCQAMLQVSIRTEDKDSAAIRGFGASAKRGYWTPDVLTGKRIQSVSLSPDGRFALTSYTYVYDNGSNGSCAELSDTRTGRLLWREDPDGRDLAWMPRSNLLYYIEKGFQGRELRTLNPATQEEKVLIKNLPEGSFNWSPNENFLIYSNSETLSSERGDLQRVLNPEDRQSGYRSRNSLYYYDLKTGIYRRLTYGKDDTYLSDICADESKLLIQTRREFLPEQPFSDNSLFLLDLKTLKTDTILYHDKYAGSGQFSPDGKKILIKGNAMAFSGIGLDIAPGQEANPYNNQLFIFDLSSRKAETLTRSFNPSVQNTIWSPMDGKIYLTAEDKDCVKVFACDPAKKTFEKLPFAPDVVVGFDVAKTSPVAVCFGSTARETGKVWSMDLKSRKTSLLAEPGKERLATADPVDVHDWSFHAADGTLIEGRYYLPPGFDATKKYPVIVYYYGGTSPVNRSFESNYPLQLYASMGYVVYNLQPSGTTGFGQKFAARHVNAWGDYTADEIILGTKTFCREHGFADSTRIGCLGASYGGFMTMYLQTKTDLFKAAVSHAGISSIASYWGEGYWGYTYSSAASSGSYPWNNPGLYWDHSPLYHADKIKTPLLLLHGTVDTNVPIGESIQMFTALKVLGKDVEFVKVEGENHGVRTFSRKLEWQRTILAYFAKYLKNDDRWWKAMYQPTAIDKY